VGRPSAAPAPWIRCLAMLIGGGVFAILLPTSTAFASHGTAPSGWPDNASQYVDRHSITTNTETAVSQGIAQLNRSDLYVTLTGSGDIDVYDANYGDTGWDGITDCTDKIATSWLWARKCDVFRIRYNQFVTNAYTRAKMEAIGCHEFGHTAGLDHRSAANDGDAISCMRGSGFASISLDNHDLDVINSHY
jgi:predicted Zn-dependent protease